MVFHKISCGVVQLGDGDLKINLGLDEIELRLCQLRLRVENKENRFCSQFVLAFIGMKRLLREVQSDL